MCIRDSVQKAQKKLYGHNGKRMMLTDIKESDKGYELEMDPVSYTHLDVYKRQVWHTISGVSKYNSKLHTSFCTGNKYYTRILQCVMAGTGDILGQ